MSSPAVTSSSPTNLRRQDEQPSKVRRTLTTISVHWEKHVSLLAIASCNLGLNLLLTVFNFYYVKVFLEHHHITQDWLYKAQIIFLIGSFIIGPLIAYAQDFICVNLSRRKIILIVGPIYAAVFMLPWFPFYPIGEKSDANAWGPGIHLTVVLLMWSTCYFIANACNCGLFAECSTDHKQRVKLLTMNQFAGCLASSAVFPVDALSNSFRDYMWFQICCGGVATLAALAFVFTGLKASEKTAQASVSRMTSVVEEEKQGLKSDEEEIVKKEIVIVEDQQVVTPNKTQSLKAYLVTVKQILENRNFCCVAFANFLHFFRVVVFQNFLAVYTEGLISAETLPTGSVKVATFYLACQLVPRAVFILVACPMVRVCGAHFTIISSFVLTWLNSAVGIFMATYVSYDSMMATLLLESCLIVFQDAYVMMYAEVIDDDMKRHKRKTPVSTVLFTMTTLFLQPSTALAPMIIVGALNFGDYELHKEYIREAPPHTKMVMLLVATCVPSAAAILSFISLFFFKQPVKTKSDHQKLIQQKEDKLTEKLEQPAP